MQKLINTARKQSLGTLLLAKLGKTVRTGTLRKITAKPVQPRTVLPVKPSAPAAKPAQPVTAKPIAPAHCGPGVFEDFFAGDLRAATDRHQSVMDQIKAVQREGSKPIDAAALLRRE